MAEKGWRHFATKTLHFAQIRLLYEFLQNLLLNLFHYFSLKLPNFIMFIKNLVSVAYLSKIFIQNLRKIWQKHTNNLFS